MSALGTDLTLLDAGFAPLFTTVSGPLLVVQAIYRRWTTDPATAAGARIYKGLSRDLRRLLGLRFSDTTLASWARDLADVARADTRVDDVQVSFSTVGRTIISLRAEIKVTGQQVTLVIPFADFSPSVVLNG